MGNKNIRNTYKRYAFISYQRTESWAAKMLSLRMSLFRLPHDKRPNEFAKSIRLTPVWRDREHLTSGVLTPQIKEALDTSKYLIVFCTKPSLDTIWVNNEVEHFLTKHNLSQIIPYIPPSKSKEIHYVSALQKAIDKEKTNNPEFDFLGISHEQEELELGLIHRLFPHIFKYEKSYVRVIARTLNLDFCDLWDEHKKLLRRIITYTIGLITFFLFLIAYLGLPISAPIYISDSIKNDSLPKARNIVLSVGNAKYPLKSLDTLICINDIPGKYRFRDIPIKIQATYYKDKIICINMGKGFGNYYTVDMERDSTFAIFHGIVVDTDGKVVNNAEVIIGDAQTYTDNSGTFRVVFPVSKQTITKSLKIYKEGVGSNFNREESPDSSKYILK